LSPTRTKIEILMDENEITLVNQNGKSKTFPRCGITNIESFLEEMARSGNLNDLVND